jgi:hypothetical protein
MPKSRAIEPEGARRKAVDDDVEGHGMAKRS